MGRMYAWATPEYLLDYMSLEEVFYYYDEGIAIERQIAENRAYEIIEKLSIALGGKKQRAKKGPKSDKPDIESFNKYYGDQIERPEKGGD